jgi:hypothetical protein
MELFALELRHQIDVALDGIRAAEDASDDVMRDVGCGRLADLMEIADRHGLTSLMQLIPPQSVAPECAGVR